MRTELIAMVETSFGSVWALELLLILHREPRHWSPDELLQELRSSELVVAQSVEALLASGLAIVESDGTVRYGPASDAQAKLVAELEAEYRIKPAAIRRLIIQKPAEKLRSFTDAFNLKKS